MTKMLEKANKVAADRIEEMLKATEKAMEGKGNRFLDRRDDHVIVRDDGFSFGTCLIGEGVVWISAETYNVILEDGDANWQFTLDLQPGRGHGMRYMMQETGYASFAKKAPARDIPLDPLTQLERDSNALLVSIATASGEFSDIQLRMFAERLHDVQSRHSALAEQLERARDMADLAAVAMVDHDA